MNLEDLKGKAAEIAGDLKDKAAELTSGAGEKLAAAKDAVLTEENTDKALDAVAGLAKKVAPGQADKVDSAREALDSKLGTE